MYLTKEGINKILNKKGLFIRPLLNEDQINEISIDLRLGSDFLVSIQGREPFINASKNDQESGFVDSFFQETRRRIGENFLLHPNQTVLASTLEYIKLPNDILGVITMRSSYSRLGLTVSSIIQPGYCGCVSLELTNINKAPINMTIGACIIQVRLIKLNKPLNYFVKRRKYICQVRPILPSFHNDDDLDTLNKIWTIENK
jgi:dCTP deaminase